YLSPAIIRRLRPFQVADDSTKPALRVEAIHDDLGYRKIRSALSRQYDLSRREPDIQVVDVDLRGDRCLVLAHYVHNGVLLEEKSCRSVIRHAATLWGYSVKLLEIDAATDKTHKTSEGAPAEAGVVLGDIDGIAAATGPGLIGGLIVGSMTAKGLAWAARKAFLAVNHLEAHALTVRLTDRVDFPYLLLLVSGGHCQLLVCAGVGRYIRLGTTLDDAVGEAFDKTAKLIGLGYPGGPAIEEAARDGDP